MTTIVTAVYGSTDTMNNVYDDLIATGIPSEEIRMREDKLQVQVVTPDATEAEVTEILERHQPVSLKH